MKYLQIQKPTGPGLYYVAEAGEEPHVVEVGIESDSHGMFFVKLLNDDHKYPIHIWSGALWFGPIEESDLKSFTLQK